MAHEDDKRAVAQAALAEVRDGMTLGLGSGSTAEAFVRALAASGRRVRCVPTSRQTARLARELGLELLDLTGELDLAVDGADRIGPGLALVKGAGGALLYEKVVASAARRFLVLADRSKVADTLDGTLLPVEVVPFARPWLQQQLRELGGTATLRLRDGQPFVTDAGHHIMDVAMDLNDPQRVAAQVRALPGVVEHGLFLGMAHAALVAGVGVVSSLEP